MMSSKPKAKKASKPVAVVKKAVRAVFKPPTAPLAAPVEKPWHTPNEFPPDSMTVEIETSGEIVLGLHSNGSWHTMLDGKSVGIKQWRYR